MLSALLVCVAACGSQGSLEVSAPSGIELNVGQTVNLPDLLEVSYNGESIEWSGTYSSNNQYVCEVDGSGKITAKGLGACVITVNIAHANEEKVLELPVVVNNFTIDGVDDSIALSKNETVTIKPTAKLNGKNCEDAVITCKSQATDIVNVTKSTDGNWTIMASDKGGEGNILINAGYRGNKTTKNVLITVSTEIVMELDKSSIVFTENRDPITLTASILVDGDVADAAVEWISSDDTIAEVDGTGRSVISAAVKGKNCVSI